MQEIVMDFDDLECGMRGLEELLMVKEHFPKFRCTCFTIPIPRGFLKKDLKFKDYKAWADELKKFDWIEIAPHGMTHQGHEMKWVEEKDGKQPVTKRDAELFIKVVEKTLRDVGLPFVKVWKSPYWETSLDAYAALKNAGYTVAIDPNQPDPPMAGLDTYKYNWSIEKPMPKNKIVKGHGHINNSANNLLTNIDKLMNMPTDAEFLTVAEYLKKYGAYRIPA